MSDSNYPSAILSSEVVPRAKKSYYPEPYAQKMEGREKRILGDLFGPEEFRCQPNKIITLGGFCPASCPYHSR